MSLENQHNDFDLFRKYYIGEMSAQEKAIFEKNLENDPFAQEAFEGFLALETDFKRISYIENTNMKFKEKTGLEKSAISLPIKTLMGIAASVVLLIASVFVIQNNFTGSKAEWAKNDAKEHAPENVETESPADFFVDTTQVNIESIVDSALAEALAPEQDAVIVKDAPIPKREEPKQLAKKEDKPKPLQAKENNKQIDDDDYFGDKNSEKRAVSKTVEEEKISVASPITGQYNAIEYTEDELEEKYKEKNISDYKTGIVAYNQSNYHKAIQSFNKALDNKTNINSANYYIGMSYFNLNKANKAINSFDKVIKTSSSFADDAQWYKALSLINKGQKEKAKQELESLSNSNSSYKNAAQKKLNSL